MADFLISEELMTRICDAIRQNRVPILKDGIADENGNIIGSFKAYYKEIVDSFGNSLGDDSADLQSENFGFTRYEYKLRMDTGDIGLVVYDNNPSDAEYNYTSNVYYFEQRAEINGVAYDKWRQIDSLYDWSKPYKAYIYTDVVVVESYDTSKINPNDVPNRILSLINRYPVNRGATLAFKFRHPYETGQFSISYIDNKTKETRTNTYQTTEVDKVYSDIIYGVEPLSVFNYSTDMTSVQAQVQEGCVYNQGPGFKMTEDIAWFALKHAS